LVWAAKRGIRIDFIQPGQTQQNAYGERCNRTVRYDSLAHHLFETFGELQEFATNWLWTSNTHCFSSKSLVLVFPIEMASCHQTRQDYPQGTARARTRPKGEEGRAALALLCK